VHFRSSGRRSPSSGLEKQVSYDYTRGRSEMTRKLAFVFFLEVVDRVDQDRLLFCVLLDKVTEKEVVFLHSSEGRFGVVKLLEDCWRGRDLLEDWGRWAGSGGDVAHLRHALQGTAGAAVFNLELS
jgi:hypothetical protein